MITVLGASGFVGTHIVNYLKSIGQDYFAPSRDYDFLEDHNLGNVIYCIGLTADFRLFPLETINAHSCILKKLIERNNFESLLYLSSTRIYQYSQKTNEESDLLVNPNRFDDIYNISKIMGESACNSQNNSKIKIVRLSNVIGNDFKSQNFVIDIIKSAITEKKIILETTLKSSKDYIMIEDVIKLILLIMFNGKYNVYNLASGFNITNEKIIEKITSLIECTVELKNNNNDVEFPIININKIKEEFGFNAQNVLDFLPDLITNFKQNN